jgi:hypothetical protein
LGNINTAKDSNLTKNIRIKCNELIIDPTHPDAERYRDSLKARCFVKIRNCDCNPAFELWADPIGNPIDAGTVVGNIIRAGTIGTEPGGLMPNTIIEVEPEPFNPDAKNYPDSISIELANCIGNNPSNNKMIIAIVDTGIDTITDPNLNRLNAWGWQQLHYPNRCISNSSNFGIKITDPRYEPVDSLGHGTAVNAVATGASLPKYIDPALNLFFLNVGIFNAQENSCTLFDALCGLNYAVNQNAKIINISWGFVFNPIDLSIRNAVENTISKVITQAPNTLFIAGMGNNSDYINNNNRFLPACLAKNIANMMAIGSLSFDTVDLAGFSNYADPEMLTLCTEGEAIIASYPNYLLQPIGGIPQTKKQVSGTSYATPMTARIAASFWQRNSGLSAAEVKSHFVNYLNPVKRQSPSRNYLKYRALTVRQIPGIVCSPPLHNQVQ